MSTLTSDDLADFVGRDKPSSQIFNIAVLPSVYFFGVSGGLVSKPSHLRTIQTAIDRLKPSYLIVFLEGYPWTIMRI